MKLNATRKRSPQQMAKPISSSSAETPDQAVTQSRGRKYAGIGQEPRTQEEAGQSGTERPGEEISSLGSLEAELLGVLWQIGKPATSTDVMEAALYKRRAEGKEPTAFATISTTLRRMSAKGLLEAQKQGRGGVVYWPTVEREQMAARILNNVSLTLLGSSLHGLLPKLAGHLRSYAGSSARVSSDTVTDPEAQRLLEALKKLADGQATE